MNINETELLPPTLEELDDDLRFVEQEMVDARDLGIAARLLLFNLVIELDKRQLIDGKEFCMRFINPLPDIEPEGAKIALDVLISQLITKLSGAVPDA